MTARAADIAARAPLPAAFFDPAFVACLGEAIDTHELIEEFDRLYDATLGSDHTEDDMRKFTKFVHDSIYMRLPGRLIQALRHQASLRGQAVDSPRGAQP